MLLLAEGQPTPEQIAFALQLLGWIGAPSAILVGLWRLSVTLHRAKAAIEKVEMLAIIVMGDGNGEYGYREARRRLEALGKKINEFQEMASGEHGFYATFAAMDAKLNQWATWRHDVIDKDLNRLALELGKLEDKVDDLSKEPRK